jgi:D-alanine transaminase
VLRETVRRNRVRDGIVYLQVTRGTARRDHPFPAEGTAPSVVVTSRAVDVAKAEATAKKGVAVITQPDIRWGRCDIKTVGLLPNVLAKQAARERGAYEAWMVDEMGLVTEGGSTNAWIVDEHGVLRTRDAQANILRGCTRAALLDLIAETGVAFEERAFTVEEAKRAKEAFFTAAGAWVMPAISIDGARVGDGKPGPLTKILRARYLERARNEAI